MIKKEIFASYPVVFEQERYNKLDFIFFEEQYQSFLSWWEINSPQLSTLSFNIKNQSRQFFGDLDQRVSFDDAFLKIRSDLWGYYLEYIKQEAILPFTNRFKDDRLVGDFYGDKPIVDLVDEREREGAVKTAMVDLEERLKNLRSDRFILRVSPKGWTNMGYEYTETQFQIFWRENDSLVRGLTIRTAVDLEVVREFFTQLGLEISETTERELLKAITKTNIVLSATSPEKVVKLISQFSNGLDHQGRPLWQQFQKWQENDGQFIRFDQLVSLLNYLEEKVKRIIDNNELSREELESLLGFALLMMAGKEKNETWAVYPSKATDHFYPDSRYPPINSSKLNEILSYLQSLPGCAGGGTFSSFDGNLFQGTKGIFVLTPFGLSEVNIQEKPDKLMCVTCPFCLKTVDAQIVNRSGKQFIHCPSCGQEVEKK